MTEFSRLEAFYDTKKLYLLQIHYAAEFLVDFFSIKIIDNLVHCLRLNKFTTAQYCLNRAHYLSLSIKTLDLL